MQGGLIIAAAGALGLVWTFWVRQGPRFGWPTSPTSRRGFCWAFPLFFTALLVLGLSLTVRHRSPLDPVYQAGRWATAVGLGLLLLAFTAAFGWPHPRWMMPAWLRRREEDRR